MNITRTITVTTGTYTVSSNGAGFWIAGVFFASPSGAYKLAGNPVSLNVILAPLPQPTPTRRVYVERRPDNAANVVYWFAPDVLPPGFVGFNVYRSPEPCDQISDPSMQLLTPSPVVVPFFTDTLAATEPFGIPSYFVTVTGSSEEDGVDRPVQLGDTSDPNRQGRRFPVLSMPRIFQEFRRRKDILLDLNGEIVTVLVRRLYGQRCQQCFVGEYETSAKASCPECYGTGWTRGYEAVYDVRCRVGSIAEALRLQPAGLELNSNPKGWSVGFPLLRNGDVIVRKTGTRYQVQRVSLTVHQGILTGQDYDLVAYDAFHPVYNFPVALR